MLPPASHSHSQGQCSNLVVILLVMTAFTDKPSCSMYDFVFGRKTMLFIENVNAHLHRVKENARITRIATLKVLSEILVRQAKEHYVNCVTGKKKSCYFLSSLYYNVCEADR